jgi:hypothetical protein
MRGRRREKTGGATYYTARPKRTVRLSSRRSQDAPLPWASRKAHGMMNTALDSCAATEPEYLIEADRREEKRDLGG